MSVAEAAPRARVQGLTLGWPAALFGLFAAALILRLIGLRTGLPYVYNADENSHFVPHAVGMFGHGYNPDYFVNPPAYTYVVHFLLALRYGTDPASVGGAYAADPTGAYTIARAASAVLGALAVPLTAIAGARLFADRRIGFIAGALLAVAFLPVHYSHFALNDAPTLAPLALCLVGVSGIYRLGRTRDYALAAVALGIAISTKYTAGIVLVTIVAAAFASPVAQARIRGLIVAAALLVVGFLVTNPYALLDHHAFWTDGIRKQTEAASDEGGKLGLANTSGWLYYLGTSTWGLGWLPSAFAIGGGVVLLVRRSRLAWVLLPAPLLLFLYLGHQTRFFARWMLPIYPLLCILAAFAVVALADRLARRWVLAGLTALLVLQGLVYTVHNDVVLARADTRMVAREWMEKNIEVGSKIVMEPIAPDQWAADVGHPLFGDLGTGTGSGNRWNKWRTSRSCFFNGKQTSGACPVIKLEDYERTLRPSLLGNYSGGGFCWVVTGSTQYGRANADPKAVPDALQYYRELAKQGKVVFKISPEQGKSSPFSFDNSFNYYPLSYDRPGPEIVIYKLSGDACETNP